MARAFWTDAGRDLVHSRYESLLDHWPIASKKMTIPTCQGETFVLTCGLEGAPALVLLHGGMATSAMWSRSVSRWAEHFHIHAVDLIGDAGFSAPSRPSMKTDDHALWLDDVMNVLRIRSASVVGASFGGWVGLDYAIRRTFRVDRLALLAPGGVTGVRLGFLLKVAPLLLLGPWGHRRALTLDMGFDPNEENTAEGKEFVSFFKLVQHHFVARTKPIPTFSDKMLASATMPVFAVLGGRDAFFDSNRVKSRLENCMPQVQVRFLPDAGHGLLDCTTDVLQFLLATAPTECQSLGQTRSPPEEIC